MGLTGTYAFVGSAIGMAKVTDSMTGRLLAEWADERFGTAALKNATVWQWGDAENAMNYWANALDQRFVTLGVGIKYSTSNGQLSKRSEPGEASARSLGRSPGADLLRG